MEQLSSPHEQLNDIVEEIYSIAEGVGAMTVSAYVSQMSFDRFKGSDEAFFQLIAMAAPRYVFIELIERSEVGCDLGRNESFDVCDGIVDAAYVCIDLGGVKIGRKFMTRHFASKLNAALSADFKSVIAGFEQGSVKGSKIKAQYSIDADNLLDAPTAKKPNTGKGGNVVSLTRALAQTTQECGVKVTYDEPVEVTFDSNPDQDKT